MSVYDAEELGVAEEWAEKTRESWFVVGSE